MTRPKGSKNKPKTVVEAVKKAFSEAVSEAVTEAIDETWKPSPDMGSIKPPAPDVMKCRCGHVGKIHYGSEHNWCNLCNCQAFTKVDK